MENVYNYQTPVDNYDDFIGRRSIVNKIYSRIGAGRPQSVSIVGDIKVGKTSLLWFLAQEKTKQSFLAHPEEYIFVTMSCRTERELTLNSFTSSLFHLTRAYSDAEEEPGDIKLRYNNFKRVVEQLHKQNRKIILFLDDFNLVTQNSAFPLEFFSFLRSLANNYNLAYVTSSYEDLQKLCVSKDIEESPFFNIFTNMSLRGFNAEEIKPFFSENHKNGSRISDTDYQYLLDLSGPSPYPLLMACQFCYDLAAGDTTGLTAEQRTQLEAKLENNLREYHKTIWQYTDDTYKDILQRIVAGTRIPPDQMYLVRDLEKKDYILNKEAKPQISSNLMRKFIIDNTDVVESETPKSDGSYLRLSQFFRKLFYTRGQK